MIIIENITKTLKTIGSIKFWFIATMTFITLSITGYIASSKVVYGGYVEKYQELDPFAKNLISVQDWWIESLLGGCIPMFLVFGIQFFLLNQNQKTKDLLFAALPFIKFLNWFAGKPIIFILGTASLFFGAILFLAIEGDSKYFWAMLIPLTLLFLTFSLRHTAGQIASGTGFSSITYKFHKGIGWGCCIIAASCWVFADIYSPFSDLYQLWSELTK